MIGDSRDKSGPCWLLKWPVPVTGSILRTRKEPGGCLQRGRDSTRNSKNARVSEREWHMW